MDTEVHAGCSLFRTLLMEDLIIYGVGALAVRGARRMLFGPSNEDRLAEQVGTSSCVCGSAGFRRPFRPLHGLQNLAGPTISHSIYDKCHRILHITEQVCHCMQVQQLRSQVAEQAQMLQQLQQGQALGTNTQQNGPLSAHGPGSHLHGIHASQGHGEGTVEPCRRGTGMAYSVLVVRHDSSH